MFLVHHCTAWDVWAMVLSLGPIEDIANDIIEEFMRMLKNNGFLNYRMAPPTKHSQFMAPGEKVDKVENHYTMVLSQPLEEGEIPEEKTAWTSDTPPQLGIVIILIDHYNATLMVPTKWENRSGSRFS